MDLQKGFDNYFNVFLRGYLKYPETFTVVIQGREIQLFPNQPSQLLSNIKSDQLLKQRLIDEVTKFLSKYISNVYNVSFSSHGTDLLIRYDTVSYITQSEGQNIDTYANIASTLNENQIDDLCRTSPELNKICRTELFWITLIKVRFPQYYVELQGGYNWEKIYKGLLYYDNYLTELDEYERLNKIRIVQKGSKRDLFTMWKNLVINYPETVRYIILNNILIFTRELVSGVFSNSEVIQVIKKLLNEYPITVEQLMEGLINAIEKNNIELMKMYINYDKLSDEGERIKLTNEEINDQIREEELLEFDKLSIEAFELIMDTFYKENDNIGFLRYISNKNIEFLKYISDENKTLIDYIIDKYTINKRALMGIFEDIIHSGKDYMFKKLYDKYKGELTKNDIHYIEEMAFDLYYEIGDENMLDVLGIEPPEEGY